MQWLQWHYSEYNSKELSCAMGNAQTHGSFKQSQIFKILVSVSDVLQPNAFNRHASRPANAVWSPWVKHVAVAVASINYRQSSTTRDVRQPQPDALKTALNAAMEGLCNCSRTRL